MSFAPLSDLPLSDTPDDGGAVAYTWAIDPTSYATTFADPTFLRGRIWSVDPTSYSTTFADPSYLRGYVLSIDATSYQATFAAVTMDYVPSAPPPGVGAPSGAAGGRRRSREAAERQRLQVTSRIPKRTAERVADIAAEVADTYGEIEEFRPILEEGIRKAFSKATEKAVKQYLDIAEAGYRAAIQALQFEIMQQRALMEIERQEDEDLIVLLALID